MLRLPSRVKLHLSRIDRALEESRRIRDEARARNVRAQLWELHMALRERAAEDAVLRSYGFAKALPSAVLAGLQPR